MRWEVGGGRNCDARALTSHISPLSSLLCLQIDDARPAPEPVARVHLAVRSFAMLCERPRR